MLEQLEPGELHKIIMDSMPEESKCVIQVLVLDTEGNMLESFETPFLARSSIDSAMNAISRVVRVILDGWVRKARVMRN